MGFHICEYCKAEGTTPATSSGDVDLVFENGGQYTVPDMITHYVEVHSFLPPQEFINDVMTKKLVGGQRRQTKSIKQMVGYLKGTFEKGTVPDGFIQKLKSVLKLAASNGSRMQTRGF